MSAYDFVVGVPVRNGLDFAALCLATLAERRRPGTRILVIDDASDPECRAALERFAAHTPGTTLRRNDRQRGFPYNCNEIVYESDEPTVCVLNSDTVVAPHWDDDLLSAIDGAPSFLLAGPSTSSTHTPQALRGPDGRPLTVPAGAEAPAAVAEIGRWVRSRFHGQVTPLPRLGGFCLVFRRTLTEAVGLFDERFGLGAGEEDDFVFRARAAGAEAVWVQGAYVHHFGHRTFAAELGPASCDLWRRNQVIYDIKRLVPLGELVHPRTSGTHAFAARAAGPGG